MSDNHGETASGKADPGSDPAAGPAGSPGPFLAVPEDAVVRRTRDGWRVGGADVPDLTCAMVLADLLAAELPEPAASRPAGSQQPPGGQLSAVRPDGVLLLLVDDYVEDLILAVEDAGERVIF